MKKHKVLIVGSGFGLGGKFAFELALQEPRLKATVAFYSHAPQIAAELRHITCPILAFYGSKEQSLIKEVDTLTQRMSQAGVDFTPVIYKDIGHAFFNDANAFSYDQQAADDAWGRMLKFLPEAMAK